MPTPDFVLALRERVGTAPLWLTGAAAVVVRPVEGGLDTDTVDNAGREEVLLVKRSDDGEWTPVTGIVDPGEHPAVTAVRECLEEARVVIEVERLVWVTVGPKIVYDNGDRTQYLDHVFRCSWVSGEPEVGDEESTDVRWWPADALPPMTQLNRDRVRLGLDNPVSTVLGP